MHQMGEDRNLFVLKCVDFFTNAAVSEKKRVKLGPLKLYYA